MSDLEAKPRNRASKMLRLSFEKMSVPIYKKKTLRYLTLKNQIVSIWVFVISKYVCEQIEGFLGEISENYIFVDSNNFGSSPRTLRKTFLAYLDKIFYKTFSGDL